VHFTGQLTPAFYHYVIDQFQALRPDLIVLTGDIVDEDACVTWLEPILGKLQAPLGRFFVLGNHERRLHRPQVVAEQLSGLGWNDLGRSDFSIAPSEQLPRLALYGNERPWFERHAGEYWQAGAAEIGSEAAQVLRIGVAHTPDQHTWARDLGIDLLLAGHTHGGQIRVPGIGPIIAPSRYGSRFASGVFRLPPTVMHVSRGLAGVHPWRWRCMPEISLLTIQPG
jgi:predicted MPP superfamily phosphohydrolase